MTRLHTDFQIKIAENGNWHTRDLELLHTSISLFAEAMGGNENFKHRLGEVLVERTDTGTSLGLAYKDRIKLSEKIQFSSWSVIHELAHVWDAKNQWKLSQALEKYTGGYTNLFLSSIKKRHSRSMGCRPAWRGKQAGILRQEAGCQCLRIFLRRYAQRRKLAF